MDRQIIYPGQIPLDTDQLTQNQNALVSLGYLIQALLGSGTYVDGLACIPTTPASLAVKVGPGSVHGLQSLEATSYGSLPADTSHQIMKQGIVKDTQTFSCPAPVTSGQSIVYLIQAIYQDTDSGSTVLPYYNASNPSVAYSGPANSGVAQNSVRKGSCVVSVKAGVAATTGTQATPAPDAGYVGLWAVTVANGQTTVTSGNIAQLETAPFIYPKLSDLFTTFRRKLTGNTTYYVSTTGSNSNSGLSAATPFLTIQKAIDVIASGVDLAGYTATIQLADGTYTGGVSLSQSWVGGGATSVVINGNGGTPANVVLSVTGADAVYAKNGEVGIKLQNLKVQTATSGAGLHADYGSQIVFSNLVFGACADAHIWANAAGQVVAAGDYSVSGGSGYHVLSQGHGNYTCGASTVTLSGTPAFASQFANAIYLGMIQISGVTFAGTGATGVRYFANANGVINTLGAGANYLPGSSPGSTSGGGQYY